MRPRLTIRKLPGNRPPENRPTSSARVRNLSAITSPATEAISSQSAKRSQNSNRPDSLAAQPKQQPAKQLLSSTYRIHNRRQNPSPSSSFY